MIDTFLILTPFLVLGVTSLLAFAGCQRVFDVNTGSFTVDIDSVTPSTGPSAGGTSVQIVGSGFSDTDSVTFGGVNATNFSVVGDTQIDAVSPPNPAGTANIVVDAQDTISNDFPFNYVAIGFVQTESIAQATLNTPPLGVTLNNTTQGNLLIAAVSYVGGTVTVADNLGNSFALAGNGPWFRQSKIFYLPNIPGGTVTITVAGEGGASGPCSMCVSEYSGADLTAAAVYGFSTSFMGTGTAGVEIMQGVAVTPAQAGDIVYAVVFASRSTALMPGAGLNLRPSTTTSLLVEDSVSAVTSAQPVATDDTTGSTFVPWVILAVAIKA